MQWSFGEQPAQPGVGKGVWYLINAPIEPSAVKTLRAARLIFRRGMLFCGHMLFCGLDFDVSRPYFRGRYTNFLSVTRPVRGDPGALAPFNRSIKVYFAIVYKKTIGRSSRSEVTNMRPAKEFPAAREHFEPFFPRLIFGYQKLSPRLNHARITQESYKRTVQAFLLFQDSAVHPLLCNNTN